MSFAPEQARRSRPAPAVALLTLAYSVACYLIFLVVLGYAAGFLIGAGVSKTIDFPPHSTGPLLAATIDLGLLALFAGQHSVMARPWFKQRLTRLIPAQAERATYVLAASLVLALLFWLWQPIGGRLWQLHGAGRAAVLVCYAAGWLIALGATFLINHADLFGLRQAYLGARGRPYSPPPFAERGFYRYVRHPLMTGFLILIWAAPTMTAGHLLFSAAATGYILIGTRFEEHDLTGELGDTYRDYAARVPALCPVPRLRLANKKEN